jgi:hypothetical protein
MNYEALAAECLPCALRSGDCSQHEPGGGIPCRNCALRPAVAAKLREVVEADRAQVTQLGLMTIADPTRDQLRAQLAETSAELERQTQWNESTAIQTKRYEVELDQLRAQLAEANHQYTAVVNEIARSLFVGPDDTPVSCVDRAGLQLARAKRIVSLGKKFKFEGIEELPGDDERMHMLVVSTDDAMEFRAALLAWDDPE